jgi:hypothetical protein
MQITNLQISNKNPLEYMRAYIGDGFAPVQQSHLLPDNIIEWAKNESMPADALKEFTEARMDLIIDKIRLYLAPVAVHVIDSGQVPQTEGNTESNAEPADSLDGYSAAAP